MLSSVTPTGPRRAFRCVEAAVPIREYLDADAFDPETIKSMSDAMADVLAALGLKDKPDELNVVVAKRIIELAKSGEYDRERLKSAVLNSFQH
jgi:hypothetical protein